MGNMQVLFMPTSVPHHPQKKGVSKEEGVTNII